MNMFQDALIVLDRKRLFYIGILALFTAAMSTSLRAGIASDLKLEMLDPINLAQSGMMLGEILGVSFLGFSIALFAISPFLDVLGMKRILVAAGSGFVVGNLIIVFADTITSGQGVYWILWSGMLLNGLAWGAVEATINPMTTALYPDDKTHKLNVLHAWWPAGIVAGGLLSVALGYWTVDWRIALVMVMLCGIAFMVLCFGTTFPKTEREESGISMTDMFKEIFRRPSFFIWMGAMFFTAATELAPGQWVDVALSNIVGMRGILLLVYVSSLMFIMRHFAGPLAKRISDVGVMIASCILAALGLYLLGVANSPLTALVAATVWGLGVALMWPTMLAAVAERYPRGGSWMIGLMGSAGAMSVYLLLPKLGQIYDQAKIAAAKGAEALSTLSHTELLEVESIAAQKSFHTVAILPVVLIFIFAGLAWFSYRQKNRKVANSVNRDNDEFVNGKAV